MTPSSALPSRLAAIRLAGRACRTVGGACL